MDSFEDKKNILLASMERSNFKTYKETIDDIGKTNTVKLIEISKIIFAPECLKKIELINVTGVYPSENLYPEDDIYFSPRKELYTQLKGIDELDIFGVSPYGDDSLIDVINKLKFVTVYVHNMKTNKQTEIWDKILRCSHTFKDSSEAKDLTSF